MTHLAVPERVPHEECWLPIGADVDSRRIKIFDLAGADYREPFLHESVARSSAQRPQARARSIGFDAFVSNAARYVRPPDGFVFHVGRCGSTLLANMLMASGHHLLIKEPDVVSDLMAGWLRAEEPATRREFSAVLAAAVRHLLEAAAVEARYRLLKFSAWNVVLGRQLFEDFPESRAIFVFRSPLATVGSLLFKPPGWFGLIERPRQVQARFFPSLLEVPGELRLSATALFAHAFRSTAEAALSLPAERVLFVDYDALLAHTETTLLRVLAFLGHDADFETLSAMVAARSRYSKDPAGRAAFAPLAEHSRPPIPRDRVAEVEAIAGTTWQRLLARASQQ